MSRQLLNVRGSAHLLSHDDTVSRVGCLEINHGLAHAKSLIMHIFIVIEELICIDSFPRNNRLLASFHLHVKSFTCHRVIVILMCVLILGIILLIVDVYVSIGVTNINLLNEARHLRVRLM